MHIDPLGFLPVATSAARTAADAARDALEPFAAVLQKISGGDEAAAETDEPAGTLSVEDDPQLAILFESLTGKAPVNGDRTISLSDVRAFARELQDRAEERISELLEEAGLRGAAADLEFSEADGTLQVTAGSPRGVLTEAALSQDEQLAGDLRRLSAIHSLLHAADTSGDFADAYEANPLNAVARFSELFERGSEPSISWVGDELRFDFSA